MIHPHHVIFWMVNSYPLSTWIPFQTNKVILKKAILKRHWQVWWTLVMKLFQSLPPTKIWKEQKDGCLCRWLVIVGEQLSVTCLRLPNLLANSNSLILRALPKGRTLALTLMKSQEIRVTLKPKNQCHLCKSTWGFLGSICKFSVLSWKKNYYRILEFKKWKNFNGYLCQVSTFSLKSL